MRLENLIRFPVFVQEPELHATEMQLSYNLMILESRRVTKFVNDAIDAMNSEDSTLLSIETPAPLLKTYFAYEGVNLIMLTLAFMLNKLLRLAEPSNFALFDDADFLSVECLKAARRSYRFKPLGCSLTPLALGVTWASTADMEKRLQASKLLDEFREDLLGSKFVRLAVLLDARYKHVGRKLGSISGDELSLYDGRDDSSAGYSSPATWSEASKPTGEAAGCCIM